MCRWLREGGVGGGGGERKREEGRVDGSGGAASVSVCAGLQPGCIRT